MCANLYKLSVYASGLILCNNLINASLISSLVSGNGN